MKYLITGGAGFIGQHTATYLTARGHTVINTDNGWRYGERGCMSLDVTQLEDVSLTLKILKPDIVLHMAAINGTQNFYERPGLVLEVGTLGAINVVKACEAANIDTLVMFSSSEVYQTVADKADESVPYSVPDPTNPRYSYAISKMVTEAAAFHSTIRNPLIVRPHNVYGPNCGEKHVIPQFIRRAQEHRTGTPFLVQGDADQTRAFCYIDDFVDGLMRVIERGQPRQVYHIGTEDERTISSIAVDVCRGVRGYEPDLAFGEGARGGPPRRCPDTRKLQSLGWSQQVGWDAGLKKTIDWFTDN